MKLIRLLTFLLLAAWCDTADAHDFAVAVNGHNVYFNILDKGSRTAIVTYGGNIGRRQADYAGEIAIPREVKHGGGTYTVVGINAKAFSGAEGLTGVVLPESVKFIGNFAFEGCTSLNKIVLPGGQTRLGKGVFFKCRGLKDVTIGSDWKELDLEQFRWSDSLSTLFIPAKVAGIRNLKCLERLKSISVDANNPKFSSHDGVLYNRSGTILYGCPNKYEGELAVADSTRTIRKGALSACREIRSVIFPEGLEYLHFREFSHLPGLSEVTFKSEKPLLTAVGKAGREVFLLQTANPELKVILPDRKSRNRYLEAMAVEEGEYREKAGSIPYLVRSDELLKEKNIVLSK